MESKLNAEKTTGRVRSRIACEACRERKRKCDGGRPCKMCRGFGYECYYRSIPRKRRALPKPIPSHTGPTVQFDDPLAPELEEEEQPLSRPNSLAYVRSVESNSGAAFVRTLTMTVDPGNAPPLRHLAWNVFLGERQRSASATSPAITDLLSLAEMRELATIYFDKVDPCYGFIERGDLDCYVANRWLPNRNSDLYDAVVCGVAALGCLFTTGKSLDMEVSLVSLAKALLDLAMPVPASVHSATGWLLRAVYLRLTARPDEAWMASCTVLHVIDAAGLHCEPTSNSVFRKDRQDCSADIRRRLFGVARHVNMWMSFDLARSRVVLHNATTIPAEPRGSDYSTELLGLLPFSATLDPTQTLSGDELYTAFSDVIDRTHTQAPSVLAQCNLMLCIYRRLHALRYSVPTETLDKALQLARRGLQAVHTIMDRTSPWHHAANVPFQTICAVLAMDTPQSLSLLGDAVTSLSRVEETYPTKAISESVSTIRALISMHQRRREADVQRLSGMLQLYPELTLTHDMSICDSYLGHTLADWSWFPELFPSTYNFGDEEESFYAGTITPLVSANTLLPRPM